MFSRKAIVREAHDSWSAGSGFERRNVGVHDASGFRFGVVGDAGTGEDDQKRLARRMFEAHSRNPWRFVLSLGDNVYDRGEPIYFESKFKSVYRPLTETGAEIHACLGNHDCEAGYEWAQVRDGAFGYVGCQDEYSFQACGTDGDARTLFICLNSCAWIEALECQDHAAIERRLARLRGWLSASNGFGWSVLYLHHPLYSYVKQLLVGDYGGHGSTLELRRVIEPELAGRVQLVLAGHDHFYQKTRPFFGSHHFVSGGGARTRGGVEDDHPDVEFAALELHFMDFQVLADQMIFRAINERGEVFHSGAIAKPDAAEKCEGGSESLVGRTGDPAPF